MTRSARALRAAITHMAQERDDALARYLRRYGMDAGWSAVFRDLWAQYYADSAQAKADLRALGCLDCPTCGQPVQEIEYGAEWCAVCGSALRWTPAQLAGAV